MDAMAIPDARLTTRRWDAIVVGAGMGGAAAAWSLASAGWSVLVLDRGPDHRRNPAAIRGRMLAEPWTAAAAAAGIEGGRDPEAVTLDDGVHRFRHHPFLGVGAGGSSALYGCALERFRESDFTPLARHPEAADSDLPEAWPFAFRHLEPWYAAAEQRLGVIGGESLATDPGSLVSPANAALARLLTAAGLHPRRLRLGDAGDGARGTTQGMLCPHGRKRDAATAFLYPAIDEHGALLLDRCRVQRLEADGGRITGVVAERGGRPLRFTARHVLLAGGALRTPALLLASHTAGWPTGLANGSGWVGRGLMRHFIDLYAVRLDPGLAPLGRKELACDDWYDGPGGTLGTLQSFGPLPDPAALVASMAVAAREEGRRLQAWGLHLGTPLLAPAVRRALAHHEVLATILEDLPYPEQRVRWSGPGGIAIDYPVNRPASRRIARMRRLMDGVMPRRLTRRIPAAEDPRRLAHACGTCRAGADPRRSVVDPWCRAHELDNLHIVDASWFPSSGGTNPGLTIAANALRVACRLADRHPRQVDDDAGRGSGSSSCAVGAGAARGHGAGGSGRPG